MIDQASLKSLLSYDTSDGHFRWLERRGKGFAGEIAGRIDKDGYREIKISGRCYFAHRLAWLYVYGKWPSMQIDHIDRNKTNNAISNLRDVSQLENLANCSPVRRRRQDIITHKRPPNPFTGAYKSTENTWRSRITRSGRTIDLGSFSTREEAAAAYENASKIMQKKDAQR